MLGTPYQTKLTFLANLLTFLLILLQWKLGYDTEDRGGSHNVGLPRATLDTPCPPLGALAERRCGLITALSRLAHT